MYPYLLKGDSFTIGTYGVMLAIAYLTGRYLYIKQLNAASESPINTELLIISLLVFGVIGAKIMFLIKNPDQLSNDLTTGLLNGSGFSSQGAILAAVIVTVAFAKFTHTKLSLLLDNAAVPAIIAYLLARIGCFLAGDDCYGIASDLPWAMSFPEGVAATHEEVHPVPLYEIAYSLIIWQLIVRYQKQPRKPFETFFLLFFCWGLCRFLVEFISANPVKLLGMSGSQFGALVMFLIASAFFTKSFLSDKKKPG
ncbi:MAG: prolipoprotein diacylglyceryl transferase [Kangiellaceae bacterium]|nr:prolipoprotein diacylglyceryl transferase [Kangiellaceae bacterium]MCW8997425.1 prolipoprotein diacylglyceryl transferase [Kangiellaceae bacterium]MCW9015525.1 prolipoprotein diacylglyceryl transferase [Kangiellaceae bacterium]